MYKGYITCLCSIYKFLRAFFFYKAAWNNQPLIKPDDEDLIWKRAGQIENVVI